MTTSFSGSSRAHRDDCQYGEAAGRLQETRQFVDAIGLAKSYQFEEAHKKIEEADIEFVEAHHMQTKLLQDEANGHKNDVSVILVHEQDHLMTSMTVKDLANEMINMYEKIQQLGGGEMKIILVCSAGMSTSLLV